MALRYQPEERALQLAEKALSMKVKVQAVLEAILDEKEKYRRRMNIVLDGTDETILHYSQDDRITDERLGWAQRNKEVIGDVKEKFEEIYGSKERGLESMRDIDGQILSALKLEQLLEDEKTKEEREAALRKMVDVAVWQAMPLLDFDEYADAGLVLQAIDIIKDRLRFPKNS